MSNVLKNWRISDLQKEEKVSKISAKINVTAFQKWKETMLQISPTDGARRCGGILKVDLLGAVFTKVVLTFQLFFTDSYRIHQIFSPTSISEYTNFFNEYIFVRISFSTIKLRKKNLFWTNCFLFQLLKLRKFHGKFGETNW